MISRYLRRSRRGSAAVEFALTFPLIVLLAIGIVEYGWLFHEYNQLHTALRDAARFGSKNATGDTAIGLLAAQTRLQTNLIEYYGICPAGLAGCAIGGADTGVGVDDAFRLTVTIDYEPITGFGIPGIPSTLTADIVFAIQP